MAWVYVARDAFNYSPNGPTSTGPFYKAKKGQYFYLIDESGGDDIYEGNYQGFWTWDDVKNVWRKARLEKCDSRYTSSFAVNYGLFSGYYDGVGDIDISILYQYAADRYGGKWAETKDSRGGSYYSARYSIPIYNKYGGYTTAKIPKGSRVWIPAGFGYTKGLSERDIRLIRASGYYAPNGTWQYLPSGSWIYDPCRDWAPSMYNLNTY